MAVTHGADLLLLGTTRRGTLWKAMKGDVIQAVAEQLPERIGLLIHARPGPPAGVVLGRSRPSGGRRGVVDASLGEVEGTRPTDRGVDAGMMDAGM